MELERQGNRDGMLVWTAALMTAATFAASCATGPPQPTAAPGATSVRAELGVTDEVLANAVYSDLNADPKYYFRHVDVTVDNGVAHLSGYVWSTDAIYRARTIARNVPGVTGVVTSQLELERNGRDNSSVAR
jgi:osmotically-inducible protein OsmY